MTKGNILLAGGMIAASGLLNAGYDVDFFLPWNRPHSGDYNLDDLFGWIEEAIK